MFDFCFLIEVFFKRLLQQEFLPVCLTFWKHRLFSCMSLSEMFVVAGAPALFTSELNQEKPEARGKACISCLILPHTASDWGKQASGLSEGARSTSAGRAVYQMGKPCLSPWSLYCQLHS